MPVRMQTARAGVAYFALVFAAGFLMGAVRVPFLVPRLGVRIAELLEMPVMFFVIVCSARYVTRRFVLPASAAVRLSVGGIALVLLLSAELVLAAFLEGLAPTQYVMSRDPVSGGVYLAMLVLFAAMPLILARVGRARLPSCNEQTPWRKP